MVQLNASTLASVKTARGVAPKTERVIQFGEGGFLRAFCDWMIDKTNEATDMDAGVVIVQPIERGMIGMLTSRTVCTPRFCAVRLTARLPRISASSSA